MTYIHLGGNATEALTLTRTIRPKRLMKVGGKGCEIRAYRNSPRRVEEILPTDCFQG